MPGCVKDGNENSLTTGYGFPFNDLFIHKTKTTNSVTTSTYKAIDWHNVYKNAIVNAIIAAIFTLPIFLIYKFIRRHLAKKKSVPSKMHGSNPAR